MLAKILNSHRSRVMLYSDSWLFLVGLGRAGQVSKREGDECGYSCLVHKAAWWLWLCRECGGGGLFWRSVLSKQFEASTLGRSEADSDWWNMTGHQQQQAPPHARELPARERIAPSHVCLGIHLVGDFVVGKTGAASLRVAVVVVQSNARQNLAIQLAQFAPRQPQPHRGGSRQWSFGHPHHQHRRHLYPRHCRPGYKGEGSSVGRNGATGRPRSSNLTRRHGDTPTRLSARASGTFSCGHT